jgi:hypothetical protein
MPERVDTNLNGRGFAYANTLWIIDRGQRRAIPTPETRNRLFVRDKDFPDEPSLGDIERGPDINVDASMINDGTTVYFFDNGKVRGITSPDVMRKYGFHGGDKVQPSVVEAIPKGDVIAG